GVVRRLWALVATWASAAVAAIGRWTMKPWPAQSTPGLLGCARGTGGRSGVRVGLLVILKSPTGWSAAETERMYDLVGRAKTVQLHHHESVSRELGMVGRPRALCRHLLLAFRARHHGDGNMGL